MGKITREGGDIRPTNLRVAFVDHMFHVVTLLLDFVGHHYLVRFSGCISERQNDERLTPEYPAPIVMTLILRLVGSYRVVFGIL